MTALNGGNFLEFIPIKFFLNPDLIPHKIERKLWEQYYENSQHPYEKAFKAFLKLKRWFKGDSPNVIERNFVTQRQISKEVI